jgi:hypothetical protein
MGTATLTAVKLQYPYQHGWVFVAQVALSGSSVSLLDSFRTTRGKFSYLLNIVCITMRLITTIVIPDTA